MEYKRKETIEAKQLTGDPDLEKSRKLLNPGTNSLYCV